MNRAELYKRDAALHKHRLNAEDNAARQIRRLTISWVKPIVEALKKHEPIPRLQKQEMVNEITAITIATAKDCVTGLTELYAQLEADILNKLTGVQRKTLSAKIPTHTLKQSPEKEKPVTKRYTGNAYGGGLTGYKIDPKTGEVKWVPRPVDWLFTRKYNLSSDVWKTVSGMENKVYALLEFNTANGIDAVETVSQLETFIKYKNGGERVAGRWRNMLTKTDANIAEGWQREYIIENFPNVQWGTPEAKRIISTPQAQAWIDANSIGKNGRKLLPPQVKAYSARIGSSGLDYRAIRITRTETARALGNRQKEIVKSSPIYTGRVMWVLDQHRDRWNCECTERGGKSYDVNDPIIQNCPVHPGCECRLVPELKSDDEIQALLKEGNL
jgi:hypothetical protein